MSTPSTGSSLKSRLHADLTTSMKAHDELRTATLRMVLSAVMNEEVSGAAARQLSDDEVLKVLAREGKKRRESAEAFVAGNRPELAERERAEGDVIAGYLPAQLSDDELRDLVTQAIEQAAADSPHAMGAVMKVVNPLVAGRAEGGRVAAEVKRQLAQ
jgi:uncharacterized protein YqeY